MRIQKAELAQKINKLKGVVPKKSNIPVLQGLLVKDGYLIANNLEMAIKAKAEGMEGENFIIPAKAFDLINSLPEGDVEIIQGKKNITIKAQKIKNRYQTMDPEEFPLSEVQSEEGDEITVNGKALLESMRRVSYAIPVQHPNPVMAAMCLQAEGGKLNFVGLDGHALAWDKVDYEGEFTLLIPKTTVERIIALGITGDVAIRHNRTSAVFVTDEYEIHTRLVEGNYFKYQQMFRELPLNTSINKDEFLDAMVRAKMCTSEKCPVKFALSGTTLDISIRDSTADYNETVFLQEELPEDMVIGFNARLVVEALKVFDCNNIGISLGGPKMPMILQDGNFKSIVLPVMIYV